VKKRASGAAAPIPAKQIREWVNLAAAGEYKVLDRFDKLGPEVLPALFEVWRGPTPPNVHGRDYLETVTEAIGRVSRRQAGPLIQWIRDESAPGDPYLWLAACALSDSRDPQAKEAMLSFLEHPTVLVRETAASALLEWEDQRAIEPIARLLGSSRSSEIIFAIVSRLRTTPRMHDERFIPPLERILSRPSLSAGTRNWGTELLATLKDRQRSPESPERFDWKDQVVTDAMLDAGDRAPSVKTLIVSNSTPLNDRVLARISQWSTLETLVLDDSQRRATLDLRVLDRLPGLKRLEVAGIKVGAAPEGGLGKHARLTELKLIHLTNGELLLEGLKRLRNLQSLTIETPPSDVMQVMALIQSEKAVEGQNLTAQPATIKAIRKLTKLERLDLPGKWISKQTCTLFRPLKKLRILRLNEAELSRPILDELARIESLEFLDIDRSPVRDEDLAILTSLPNLKGLSIRGTGLTGECIPALIAMSRLRQLVISHLIKGQSRKQLKAARPDLKIDSLHSLKTIAKE
jgi:hypothetical protein